MCLLRAWKIGELEAVAAQKETSLDQVSALDAESPELRGNVATASYGKSGLVKRLCAWKKV